MNVHALVSIWSEGEVRHSTCQDYKSPKINTEEVIHSTGYHEAPFAIFAVNQSGAFRSE